MTRKSLPVSEALKRAGRLAAAGDAGAAAALYRDVLARFPGNRKAAEGLSALPRQPVPAAAASAVGAAEIDRLIGLYRQQRYDEALRFGAGLAARGALPVIHNVMGAAEARLGRTEAALACYERALAIDPNDVQARYNLGVLAGRLDRLDAAARHLAAAIALAPENADAHGALGSIRARQGRLDEAVAAHETALGLRPGHAPTHLALGDLHERSRRDPEAEADYREAVRLAPDLAPAHLALCDFLEKRNRIGDLAAAIAGAEALLGPGNPRLALRAALLAQRQRRLEDARRILEAVPDEALPAPEQVRHAALLGRVLDRLGDFGAAFARFRRMNERAARLPEAAGTDAGRYLAEIEALAADWQVPARPWPALPPADAAPVFIVGFPRSGTTLLDTILRGHPGIAVIEEGAMVSRMRDALGALPTASVLGAATQATIEALRAAYMTELSAHPEYRPGTRVIDKLPLSIKDAGLIARVFPGARFVLALRHPCDAVLSCFMQNFAPNDAMANFLEIEAAARLYDRIMTLWTRYAETLELSVHELRYEDLVGDLEGTVAPLIRFLGLDWDDNLANYRETALARGRINTPSYHQVTETLHTRAVGRWTAYREPLAPALSLLEPWARRFGYGM